MLPSWAPILEHVVEQCRYKNVHVVALDRRDQVEHFDQVVDVRLLACPFTPMVAMSLGREDQSSRQSPHIACHTGNRSIYRRQGAGDK